MFLIIKKKKVSKFVPAPPAVKEYYIFSFLMFCVKYLVFKLNEQKAKFLHAFRIYANTCMVVCDSKSMHS